jgi:RNA polymerase sigma-70 factor, ECF subfamily
MSTDNTNDARRSAGPAVSISSGNSTSRSLLERLKSDQTHAWEELVSLYAPLVYCWCRKSPVVEQEIPDIVQNVFQSVSTSIHKFRKDRAGDTFRGWLRTITRNKIADFYRRQDRIPSASGGTDAHLRMMNVPEAAFENDDSNQDPEIRAAEHALFHRALELLRKDFEPKTWQAFWRVVVDERTPNEVADELGMRPGTVRVAKSRVLQRLRQKLGDVID